MTNLTVKCNGQVEVVCSLQTNRVENFISKKLSNKLKLEKKRRRNVTSSSTSFIVTYRVSRAECTC